MSEFTDIIHRLNARYPDLVLDPSGQSADKFITTQADLKLYDGKAPGDWELIDKKTKGITLVKDVEDSPKKLIVLEFLDFYNSVKKEIHEKDPIENLKAGGFKGLGSDETELKTSGEEETKINEMERVGKESEAELARVIKQKESEKEEENARKREENEKRLEIAMQAKQQEEEELEHLKKENEALEAAKEEEDAERLRVEFPPAFRPGLSTGEEDPEEDIPPVKKGEVKLLDILYDLIEDDLLQIFGHTGTGKTSIAMKAATEARELKKSVIYIDTEHNITKSQAASIKKLGIIYEYIPKFENLYTFIKRLPKYDVVIVDSLGLPILSLFAEANMKEKGNALMKMIAISAFLKNYANENHSLVIVLNQPESDMNKDPLTERKPFGDKSSYCYKEIISSKFAKGGRTEKKTTIVVKAFRSRSCGMGTKLFTVEITDAGIKVIQ